MKQENYAQKLSKKRRVLFLNPLTGNKILLFSARKIKTENKRHIEIKESAANPISAASSNYILSIIFI
jgi:hypothetical protein